MERNLKKEKGNTKCEKDQGGLKPTNVLETERQEVLALEDGEK